ncbi:hypothetical protein AGABI2DRAFT_199581 [Agaricus bisporus var. bisporus H97]|uniref:hypothetical protein n=1 Tax=Agaricus bisporus var. bisporus (strain H97 / ATCC MYA-4626 / FGSC 10389) TaxID=936046 RepID=UPI00029F756A|nr:hypothetical protein AGABI2DRAFT_199581 [Agaricus bisporus var. bisporus H97]EKV50148.1 hypothetical protein AGABI2DRAFT_199581 [Agaricus bisporus var. bisporus H97]
MPSSAILRGSRSLIRSTVSVSSSRVCPPRSLVGPRKRLLSSVASDSSSPESPVPPENAGPAADPPEAAETATEEEKPRVRRTRIVPPPSKDTEPVELPQGLDILWSPADEPYDLDSTQTTLPPPEVFEEALHHLHITLHPQTQHRAVYPSTSGPPVEPTFGLYCPIEGGDYIIDATVRELARRTNAEVLVIDAVQLAAEEWGQFGKAASSLQLPKSPLHFSMSSGSSSSGRREDMDEDDDYGSPAAYSPPQQMTLTLLASPMQGRSLMTPPPSRRTASPPSKIKAFFDALVNTPSKQEETSSSSVSSERPRFIYVRDFPTLAASADIWYPPLLSAVRSRRRGPISRPTSAISRPMTIIFGMTPPLLPGASPSPPPERGFMGLVMNRHAARPLSNTKTGKVDWGEDEASEKAREKRLRDKLRKWGKNDPLLYSEFPTLTSAGEAEEGGSSKPDFIFIGGGPPSTSGIPSLFGPPTPSASRSTPNDHRSTFYRSSILVPAVRSPMHEKAARVARRREINELTMRMGVGAIGGQVEESSFPSSEGEIPDEAQLAESPSEVTRRNHQQMWEQWGNKIELWQDVRRIADRAVGNIMSNNIADMRSGKASLEPTVIPWSVVGNAWASHKVNLDVRKQWLKDVSPLIRIQENDEEDETESPPTKVDEVVERLKNDGELDDHEERLLPCFVNSATMPTSFEQVHLPQHTIDSVRTIVSLPLLHPQAFKQGILKEHVMTGCLLFGPPGTGKTLVVRALAKEAGCRMLAVSPSDVMDMYVGEGEKLVRAVFSLARKLSPCVIFLDEIDALFGARMSTRESGGAFAHRGVITEFMQEMDGLKSSRDDNIIVIGATNRPFDLDDAILRRLPRRLLVDLPGEREREEILKILLRDETLASDVDINRLAKQTMSFSGSDLKHLCVSAALDAVKEHVHLPWATGSSANSQTEPTAAAPSSSVAQSSSENQEAAQAVTQSTSGESAATEGSAAEATGVAEPSRALHLRNFTKALKEITPSSSESLGSLTELRKWNEEFGEGRQNRKRHQVWGRGRFGFVEYPKNDRVDEGKVLPTTSFNGKSKILEILDMQRR